MAADKVGHKSNHDLILSCRFFYAVFCLVFCLFIVTVFFLYIENRFWFLFTAGGATPEASDRGAVRFKIREFWGVDSKSLFRGLPEVKIQQKMAFWKAESLSFSVLKELAREDASIASYSDFESDHFVVGRLRRRASGGKKATKNGLLYPKNQKTDPKTRILNRKTRNRTPKPEPWIGKPEIGPKNMNLSS